ncbi:DNA-3-methyladenine glycosylase family protein [Amycolatopsis jiangsuensis]|uniref:DNA-3-methyladenine glycosylase II n=1 Tax=Amycolatopsis jiangsuensis TaxID=1181879 RepID=A0A840J6U3_9PSEU|nr:DNA-3-methyladenine glycosylase 2 family protein [Amycolatopsis jiangsuensis]MBB4689325.1 DNA-3-methyladenine glycosylase II [Amycolatopsis jiangsuensis]
MTAPILNPIDLPAGEIAVRGAFDLAAAARRLVQHGSAGPGAVRLAFPVEGPWVHAGALIRQSCPGMVEVEVIAPVEVAARVVGQVRRMFSLDVDAASFLEVATRDPIARRLMARHPGVRPVLFSSPYEAACWAVLTQGRPVAQAERCRQRLVGRYGRVIEHEGVRLASFPVPQALAGLTEEPGLGRFRLARLRAVARAAVEGRLEAEELRALPIAEALARLRAIPGIGAFSAEQILQNGAGHPDLFPRLDTRLHRFLHEQYSLPPDSPVQNLEELAGEWRPYRSWVAHLWRVDQEASVEGARW